MNLRSSASKRRQITPEKEVPVEGPDDKMCLEENLMPGQSGADDVFNCVVRNKESIPPSYADDMIKSEDFDPLPV
jgi:hypothetical protein